MAPGVILSHGPAGPPGVFGEWLEKREIPFRIINVWENGALPDPDEHEFVVSLGSQHSVRDREPAWIGAELRFLERAVGAEVPVLGLCFGGQALSTVLGGGVERLPRPEIGWVPVRSEADWLSPGPWLQYHKENLKVPPGARRIADSDAGPAGFAAGPHIGVQFHPEVTPEILDRWASMDGELAGLGLTREDLAAQSAQHAAHAREGAFELFDAWWELARGSRG